MRRRFLLLAFLAVLVAGVSMWRLSMQKAIGGPSGTVAGARITSPDVQMRTVPFLRHAATQQSTLFFWDATERVREQAVPGDLPVRAAAITQDGHRAFVAVEDGAQTVFWLIEDSKAPEFMAAVQGTVTQARFAPSGRFVSILLRRPSAPVPELSVLDTGTKRLSRLLPAVQHATWLTRTLGLVAVLPDGTLSYATLRSDGAADVVALPAVAQSNVAVQPATDVLYFVRAAEQQHMIAAYDLVRREQSVVTQLTAAAEQYQLSVNEAGTDLAVHPVGTATPLFVVTLATGSITDVHTLSGPVAWVNDGQLLVEQSNGAAIALALFSIKEQKPRVVVAEGDNHLSL